jgi:SMI1 / KNR4 family (SUKH-1)
MKVVRPYHEIKIMNKYQPIIEKFNGYYVYERKKARNKITEDDIKEFEIMIGETLPKDYAEFLQDYGCYGLEGSIWFPFLEPYPHGDGELIDVFFGLNTSEEDDYSLIEYFKNYEGRMPKNMLPIASDPGASKICLSLSGDDRGAVYYWYFGEEEMVDEGEEPGYSNLYLIANSFDEFMNVLQAPNDEDEQRPI